MNSRQQAISFLIVILLLGAIGIVLALRLHLLAAQIDDLGNQINAVAAH